MVEGWLEEVKEKADPEGLGMILVHNGIVRGSSKEGRPVKGMRLSYDVHRLERLLKEYRSREGIVDIRAWINEGDLKVGDDIMLLLVAGRFRTDVLPVFEAVLAGIKREIVKEREIE